MLRKIGVMMPCYAPVKILQWNLNGLQSRLPHLQALMSLETPNIMALQELKQRNENFIYFRNYTVYKLCRNGNIGGGVCIAVHNNIPSVPLKVEGGLEAIACKVFLDNCILHICNVYFNEGANINSVTLNELIKSIPTPRLILGDINGKHHIWGSPDNTPRGVLINDIFSYNDLYFLNDGSPTYFNPRNNYFSHLDVTACSDSISHKFQWSVYHDKLSSDHYPIFIKYNANHLYTSKSAKWKLPEANWAIFRNSVTLPDTFSDPNEDNHFITTKILDACSVSIPRTSTNVSSKYSCFWWNDDCAEALNNTKRQLRKLYKRHTPADIIEYFRLNAISRKCLIQAKRSSWIEKLKTVNKNTPLKQLWNTILSLSGKPRSSPKIILNINGNMYSDPKELTNMFGNYFANISSDDNYDETFLLYKVEEEFEPVVFLPGQNETYNSQFDLLELVNALNSCKNTSPGEDGTQYTMLENLPENEKYKLLCFYNYLWNNQLFPEQWRTAIVLPFHKSGKPRHLMSSYRPISLTSCVCKLFERMVLFRLTSYLETNHFIKSYQSGFRKLHSTYDALTRFESAIQDTFKRGDYLVAVFIDLEKAYDMVWKHLVLKILSAIGLKGNLPEFISNFIEDHNIKVKIGDILSQAFNLDNGLPQGSVLSCILFTLVINSIFDELEEVSKSLFCDDGLFWAVGGDLPTVINTMQRALDRLDEWCTYNGPKISILKTTFGIFTKNTGYIEPQLFLEVLPYN